MPPPPDTTAEPLAGSAQTGRPALSVIVPMFREAARIGPTLADIMRTRPDAEVLLVNDGSDDTTAEACRTVTADTLEQLEDFTGSVVLLHHKVNRGKGAAVRTGLAHARGDLRLVTDADNATQLNQLPKLTAAQSRSGADLIAGSRSLQTSDVESVLGRRITGKLFKLALRSLGLRLCRDTQCGYKLYTARAASIVTEHGEADGYCFDIEHLLLVNQAQLGWEEVGIKWRHVDGGQVRPIRDGIKMLFAAKRIRDRLHTLGPIDASLHTPVSNAGVATAIEPKPAQPIATPAGSAS